MFKVHYKRDAMLLVDFFSDDNEWKANNYETYL